MKVDLKILDSRIAPDMLKPKTPGSAGIDLMSCNLKDFIIYPGQCEKINTGIAIHLNDPGYAAIVIPRSGLGHQGLVLGNAVGLIDSDYQGEIILSMWNRSSEPIKIKPMDRIAQLVIVPVIQPQFNIVDSFEQSERGANGFGSTGINILFKD